MSGPTPEMVAEWLRTHKAEHDRLAERVKELEDRIVELEKK